MVSRWGLLVPRWLRAVPADLAATVAFVAITLGTVFLPVVNETPLRVVVGLPFVLFVPGYAFVAALFPKARGGSVDDETSDTTIKRDGIDFVERVVLSFGTSIAIVSLIGLILNFTPWGIRQLPIVLSASGFTFLAAAVGTFRRNELPADERFSVPYREWYAAGREELFAPETRTEKVFNILLVVSILLAVGTVGYAVVVPKQGAQFTEFYLLTEGEDGELVADNYPENFTAGEPRSLYVGIENQEHQTVSYTVIVAVQNVTFENNESRVLNEERLRTFQVSVSHNETWQLNHSVAPTLTGNHLRLTYLLYKRTPPQNPTDDNAYREVHLWVTVTEPSDA